MFPPIVLHTTVPWTAWSLPSIVTVVLPCADAAYDVEPLVSAFLSPDEQPDRPAITIAAPPTATTNPRFTTVLLLVVVIRQDRRIIPDSMVGLLNANMAIGRKICPFAG